MGNCGSELGGVLGLWMCKQFQVDLGFYKRKLRTGRRTQCFMNLNIFCGTDISSFVHTQKFIVDSLQSFINEAPGLGLFYLNIFRLPDLFLTFTVLPFSNNVSDSGNGPFEMFLWPSPSWWK